MHTDGLLAAARRQQLLRGAGLIDYVDGLVGQVPVVDVADRQLHRRAQRLQGVAYAVVLFETVLQAAQDIAGLIDGRFDHVDFLETTRQRPVLFEDVAVFLIGGRADAFQITGRQRRLEQVRGVHGPARSRTGADDGVNFVNEQHGVRLLAQLRQHRLEALLEIAAILGAGQQRAHVEGVHHRVGEHVRHFAVDDLLGQPFGDGGLADAGLADEQRIVLAAAAQHLHRAFNFLGAADQRIDLAQAGLLVQVHAEHVERAALGRRRALFALFRGRQVALGVARHLGDAVRKEIHHVETADVLLVQEIYGVRLLLAEDRHHHVGAGDLFLSHALHVQDRALNDALETDGRLGVNLAAGRQARHVFPQEAMELPTQLVDVAATGPQHLDGGGIVQQRHQQMLHGNEFVALFARLLEGTVQ